MQKIVIQIAIITIACAASYAIPWPVGETQSEQNLTHTIMNNYGDYNIPWAHACEDSCNFHFGIDFDAPPAADGNDESENVWSVESGEITDYSSRLLEPGTDEEYYEWTIVVCEDQLAEEGWCYQHIEPPAGVTWDYGYEINYPSSDPIATMAELQIEGEGHYRHLHLMRSLPVYVTENPGLANPLAYFDPSPVSPDFTWSYFLEAPNYYFFLPNTDAVDPDNQMEGGWGTEYPTVTEAQNAMFDNQYGADLIDIWGEVDFFGYVLGNGTGQEGGPASHYIMPQKISWALYEWDPGLSNWVPVQEFNGTDFIRYVVDFADITLGGSDNWDEYKQFYFRFQPAELFSATGRTYCLTNCSDAVAFDGISNIEENCWNTALSAEGSGETYHPDNMLTPDGEYRATIHATDWDGTDYEYSFNFMLHNHKEIAQEVRLSDAATDEDIWHAEWTASYDTDGFEPVKNVYVNETTEPGTTLDIEIVFSGPMSTAVDPYVRFTKPEGGYIVASPGSPEWTSTNQPDGYYDTWNGTVDVPAEGFSGWMTMKIKAKDISDIGLLDPSIAYPDPPSPTDEEYTDDHHGFGIAVTPEPGWPVFLEHWISGSPVAGDLDGDGDMDIAVQSKEGVVQLIDESGNILQSMESGDWSGYNYPLVSSPAIADLDLDGDMEVIAVHPYGANAWHAETGSPVPGWPVYMGNESTPGIYPARSAPVVCDLIGDAHPEIVLCRHLDLSSPNSINTVWLFEHDGGQPVWQTELESGGVSVASTPAAGDISSSHAGSEILVCTSDGYVSNYPYPPPDRGRDWNSALYLLAASDGSEIWKSDIYNCYFFASPVVGDVDGDGLNEIVVGTHIDQAGHRVLILDAENGNLEHSFSVSSTVPNSSALGDMDGDGCLDIVSVDNTGHVYCWSGADYSNIDGFPVEIAGNPSLTSPTIADIDGDFQLEIVIGTDEGELYAINRDGSICSGYPLTGPGSIEGQPLAANLDNDSSLELVFADGSDSYIYCYDLGDNSFPALMPWRQFQHDSRHTGLFEADNTVPAPPTNLQVAQQTDDVSMLLTWDLSVNDFHSSSPEEPTDVVSYQIYRGYPPSTLPSLVSRVHAGTETYIDTCDPWGPQVEYYLTASDGTNESSASNSVRVRIESTDIISCGCSVSEVFEDMPPGAAVSVRPTSEISSSRRDDSETSDLSPASSVRDESASLRGNPSCLTDGSLEEGYTPSQGAGSVVIDLGEECSITAVVPQDQLTEQRDIVGTTSAVDTQERQLRIEVAGSDRNFESFSEGIRSNTEGVRYVRVHDASGLAEISVYGSRSSTNSEPMSLDIVENHDSEGWSFSLPAQMLEAGGSSELSVKIFDITGRMVWSGRTRSGSVLHWDGCSEGTPVPSGVYLLQCSIGSEVSTGSFVVRSDR